MIKPRITNKTAICAQAPIAVFTMLMRGYARVALKLLSNGFLHDTDSQRIRSGVYADGGTDLEDGNGVDVVSLLLQSAYLSVPKLHGFFLIVAVSYTDTVICNICLLLCQLCQQQVDSLVHGLAAASADTGREDLAFL